MIETDSLLVKCPNCGAWPMAANLPKAIGTHGQVRFRCRECHYQESGTLQRAGKLHVFPQQRAQAQGR